MNVKISCLFVFLLMTTGLTNSLYAAAYSDRIVAVVNNDVILESDLKKQKQPFMRNALRLPLGIVPPGKWPTEKEILDELIVVRLLEQEAAKKGINVDEKGVDASIDSIKKRNNLTQDQFLLFLAGNGITYDDYRNMLKRQVKLTRLISSEVVQKVPMSEEDAQQYFKKNKDKIDEEFQKLLEPQAGPAQQGQQDKPDIPTEEEIYTGGTLRLQRIVLKMPRGGKKQDLQKLQNTAREIYKQAMTGADFGKLAQKYSQEPLAKKGGDLGYMEYKDLVPQIQKVVQRMKPGAITPPLMGGEGLMMLYLADAKNRTTKTIPIPKKEREAMEKQWFEAKKKREAELKERATKSAKGNPREENPGEMDAPSSEADRPKMPSGILTPAEEKEYLKVRKKVISILRNDKIQGRMKEWVEELKKNSIIEVKL
ncbi:MAG: peptidylprolyl isomerase [Desulfomonile tiedjei]|nr:peptidylprolyl isomerase [Desulfomonile tiedjei]